MNARAHHKNDDLIQLSAVCATLVDAGVPPPPGGLRWLQISAASARFPCCKRNQKWFVFRRDLSHVARAYGAVWPEGE